MEAIKRSGSEIADYTLLRIVTLQAILQFTRSKFTFYYSYLSETAMAHKCDRSMQTFIFVNNETIANYNLADKLTRVNAFNYTAVKCL